MSGRTNTTVKLLCDITSVQTTLKTGPSLRAASLPSFLSLSVLVVTAVHIVRPLFQSRSLGLVLILDRRHFRLETVALGPTWISAASYFKPTMITDRKLDFHNKCRGLNCDWFITETTTRCKSSGQIWSVSDTKAFIIMVIVMVRAAELRPLHHETLTW